MISFSDLLARADIQFLDSMLPKGAGPIIRAIDERLMYPKNLAALLVHQVSAQSLLLTPSTRNELLDLMPISQAQELARLFGCQQVDSPYQFLKSLKLSRATEKSEFLAFFGEPFDEEKKENKPSEEVVGSEYPLFIHQIKALSEVREQLSVDGGRVLLHMPTGSGKTRTAVNFAAEYLRQETKRVVVWLANSEELCDQAFDEFKHAWGKLGNRNISCLKYWGKNRTDISSLEDGFVVLGLAKAYAGIVADHKNIGLLSAKNPLVIFDEAHQVIANTYKQVTSLLLLPYSKSRLLGLSATPGRTWNDPVKDEMLSEFFGKRKVTLTIEGYDNPVTYLIESGYLARPIFRTIKSEEKVSLSASELAAIEHSLDLPKSVLERLGVSQRRNLLIVYEIERLLKNHKRVILFASSVAQSDLLASVLSARGKLARSVTSSTSEFDRKNIIDDFKSHDDEIKLLCNFGILTTGFDAPRTSAALIARPTLSLVLYSQMVGRALRGTKAGGNEEAEIVTVIDEGIEQFNSVEAAFSNWEDVWKI